MMSFSQIALSKQHRLLTSCLKTYTNSLKKSQHSSFPLLFHHLRTSFSSSSKPTVSFCLPIPCNFGKTNLSSSISHCLRTSPQNRLLFSKQQEIGNIFYRGNQFTCSVHFFHTHCILKAARPGNPGRTNPIADKNKSVLIYMLALFILMLGGAYAGVPLYKVFCQATGLGGQAFLDTADIESMQKVERPIRVRFNADVASSMRWNFKPQQNEVTVFPGETALAFYTATNPTDKPIIGISTYNILPFDAGQYFNKIQCFCFEEQRLNPKEQVDMPVFFYIDPEFAEDPKLEHVSTITLSYTFFEAVDGLTLPLPGYPQPHDPVVPSTS